MSTNQLTDEQIRDGIKTLMTSMLEAKQNESIATELYQLLLCNPEYLSNPKTFFYLFLYKQENVIKAALTAVKELPLFSRAEYIDIFMNYRYYKAHIEKLCIIFEGSFGCADKSGVIIGRYLTFLATGDEGKWEIEDEHCYWLPRFGTQKQWYSLLRGLYFFKNGYVTEFTDAYQEVLAAGTEKYNIKINQ